MSPGGRKTDLNATSRETVSRAAFHCARACVRVCAAGSGGGGDMSENDQKQSLNFRCSEATSGENYSSDLSASLQNESYDAKKEARERGGRINKADW